jgi:hypothetical protein
METLAQSADALFDCLGCQGSRTTKQASRIAPVPQHAHGADEESTAPRDEEPSTEMQMRRSWFKGRGWQRQVRRGFRVRKRRWNDSGKWDRARLLLQDWKGYG